MGCLFSLSSKGDAVPLRYAPGSGENGGDNPLSSARRTRPRRCGAGRGIKVRQSWTFMGNFMRRSAERLSCLFCLRQNTAGNCARRAQKRHAFGVPFLTLRGRKFPYGNLRTFVFCKVKTQIAGETKFRGRLDFHGPRELAFVLGDKVELVGQLGGKSMERLFVACDIFQLDLAQRRAPTLAA